MCLLSNYPEVIWYTHTFSSLPRIILHVQGVVFERLSSLNSLKSTDKIIRLKHLLRYLTVFLINNYYSSYNLKSPPFHYLWQ